MHTEWSKLHFSILDATKFSACVFDKDTNFIQNYVLIRMSFQGSTWPRVIVYKNYDVAVDSLFIAAPIVCEVS